MEINFELAKVDETDIILEFEREKEIAQNFYLKVGFEDHDRYLMTKWIT